jgi:hypothetical protein
MKNIFKAIFVIAIVLTSCEDDDGSPTTSGVTGGGSELVASAGYTLTFGTTFSEETYPMDYPANATFGPIVAIMHAPEVTIFQSGQLASDGLKAYAEDGDVGALAAFLTADLGEEGDALFSITTETASSAVSTTTINVTATPSRTRITFLAKLNPSPDWFVGVSSFDVTDGNNLIEFADFDLVPIDAGTDAGNTYNADNEVESLPIANYEGAPFGQGPFFPNPATLTIERNN